MYHHPNVYKTVTNSIFILQTYVYVFTYPDALSKTRVSLHVVSHKDYKAGSCTHGSRILINCFVDVITNV